MELAAMVLPDQILYKNNVCIYVSKCMEGN